MGNLKKLGIAGEGVKLEFAEISINEEMKCTGQELYNAFTRKDMIQIFTNCEAKMMEQAIEGGSFELLGGNITGKFIEVTPFTKIVKDWRLKSCLESQSASSKVKRTLKLLSSRLVSPSKRWIQRRRAGTDITFMR